MFSHGTSTNQLFVSLDYGLILKFAHNLSHLRILQNRGEITFQEYKTSFYVKYQNSYLFDKKRLLYLGGLLSIFCILIQRGSEIFGIDNITCKKNYFQKFNFSCYLKGFLLHDIHKH